MALGHGVGLVERGEEPCGGLNEIAILGQVERAGHGAKADDDFARLRRAAEVERGERCVMAGKLARCLDSRAGCCVGDQRAGDGGDHLARDGAFAQEPCAVGTRREDGGFDPHRRWATIEDGRDPPAQSRAHMRRRGGADLARWVGRGGRDGPGRRLQHRLHHRVGRQADRHGCVARRDARREPMAGFERQHKRQRSGPEGVGQGAGGTGEIGDGHGAVQIGQMHDQRVEIGPALGGIDRGHGAILRGISGQTIDRFAGQCDKRACAQQGCGARDTCRIWEKIFGHAHRSDVT